MSKNIDDYKSKNIDKIKIGCCIQLSFLLDNFYNDFERITNFIKENSNFLNNQTESNITLQLEQIQEVLSSNINILLCDIDKKENYCDYLSKFY